MSNGYTNIVKKKTIAMPASTDTLTLEFIAVKSGYKLTGELVPVKLDTNTRFYQLELINIKRREMPIDS